MALPELADIVRVIKGAGDFAHAQQHLAVNERKEVSSSSSDEGGDAQFRAEVKSAFSSIDTAVQDRVVSGMSYAIGRIGFVCEEESPGKMYDLMQRIGRFPKEGYTGIVDPIDGSNNYLSMNPANDLQENQWRSNLWGVSFALAHGKDLVQMVVYYPGLGVMLTAEQGSGTYINDEKVILKESSGFNPSDLIRVSSTVESSDGDLHQILRDFPSQTPKSYVVTFLSMLAANANKEIKATREHHLMRYGAYLGQFADLIDLGGTQLAWEQAGGIVYTPQKKHISLLNNWELAPRKGTIFAKPSFIMAPNEQYLDGLLAHIGDKAPAFTSPLG